MGGRLRRRVERSSTFKTLTNAPRKVINIVSKNADYRRPMSRINLLDTKATSTYLVPRSLARARAASEATPQLEFCAATDRAAGSLIETPPKISD